jgi:hypothetical protein
MKLELASESNFTLPLEELQKQFEKISGCEPLDYIETHLHAFKIRKFYCEIV